MDPETPGNVIILHPDFAELKAEVERLHTELSTLVLERDHLVYHVCRNLETAYVLSIGALAYKAYELECAVLRFRRKAELIQAKRNRQEKIDLSEIEAILDAEFAEYLAKLREQLERMNDALERGLREPLTEEERNELRSLYRDIVKALHPDLHPNLSSAHLRLFHQAVRAYEHGDLEAMRVIAAMLSKPALPDHPAGGLAAMTREKGRLTGLVERLRVRIAEIKSKYPYTLKDLMQSPEAVEARKAELSSRIKELTEALAAYKAKIDELLRVE